VVLNVLDNVPSSFDQLGARLDQAALLQQAGIKFAFMTEDLFTETRMLSQAAGVAVAYGLPWLAAMKAITLNPAQIWGVDDKTGSITSGKQANLVVWSGDPLELDSFPERIMMNGKWIDMQTRQQLLRDRYREIYRKDTPFGYR
jgi:imidazolonepropionase-like amidohydrolase